MNLIIIICGHFTSVTEYRLGYYVFSVPSKLQGCFLAAANEAVLCKCVIRTLVGSVCLLWAAMRCVAVLTVQRCLCGTEVVRTERTRLLAAGQRANQ